MNTFHVRKAGSNDEFVGVFGHYSDDAAESFARAHDGESFYGFLTEAGLVLEVKDSNGILSYWRVRGRQVIDYRSVEVDETGAML